MENHSHLTNKIQDLYYKHVQAKFLDSVDDLWWSFGNELAKSNLVSSILEYDEGSIRVVWIDQEKESRQYSTFGSAKLMVKTIAKKISWK